MCKMKAETRVLCAQARFSGNCCLHEKLGQRCGADSPHRVLCEVVPQCLDISLPAPRGVEAYIFVVFFFLKDLCVCLLERQKEKKKQWSGEGAKRREGGEKKRREETERERETMVSIHWFIPICP